jgi:hypothetical protein
MHAFRENQESSPADQQEPAKYAEKPRLALVERPGPIPERKPLSLASIERVRSTSATLRRIENMQKLIAELQQHEMLADEIAWFLKFSRPAPVNIFVTCAKRA